MKPHDPACNPGMTDDRLGKLEVTSKEYGQVLFEVRDRLTIIETKLSSALWAARALGAVAGAGSTMAAAVVAWLAWLKK